MNPLNNQKLRREQVVAGETYRKLPVDERRKVKLTMNTSWSCVPKLVGYDGVGSRYSVTALEMMPIETVPERVL